MNKKLFALIAIMGLAQGLHASEEIELGSIGDIEDMNLNVDFSVRRSNARGEGLLRNSIADRLLESNSENPQNGNLRGRMIPRVLSFEGLLPSVSLDDMRDSDSDNNGELFDDMSDSDLDSYDELVDDVQEVRDRYDYFNSRSDYPGTYYEELEEADVEEMNNDNDRFICR